MVMVTPGKAASDSSVTLPLIAPVVELTVWAAAPVVVTNAKITPNTRVHTRFIRPPEKQSNRTKDVPIQDGGRSEKRRRPADEAMNEAKNRGIEVKDRAKSSGIGGRIQDRNRILMIQQGKGLIAR